MSELIRDQFYNQFMDLCSNSKESIKLCAPFVKSNIINEILSISKKDIELSLITNINLNSLCHGALDISALKILSTKNYPITNAQNLHAKIYIFDDNKCAITSANLSYSGLRKNIEYGVIIDNKSEINKVINDYNRIITNQLNGEITLTQINQIKKLLMKFQMTNNNFNHDISENFNELININSDFVQESFNGWQKLVIDSINEFDKEVFTRKDFQNIESKIKIYYPKSNTPLQTVSRVLQELRDLGLIKFLERGVYQKLWINY